MDWTEFGKAFSESELGEAVTYFPYDEPEKAINAVIERSPETLAEFAGRTYSGKFFTAYVVNDSTAGVTKIRKGLDKIELPITQGGEKIKMVVSQILEEDPSGWKLELRA